MIKELRKVRAELNRQRKTVYGVLWRLKRKFERGGSVEGEEQVDKVDALWNTLNEAITSIDEIIQTIQTFPDRNRV